MDRTVWKARASERVCEEICQRLFVYASRARGEVRDPEDREQDHVVVRFGIDSIAAGVAAVRIFKPIDVDRGRRAPARKRATVQLLSWAGARGATHDTVSGRSAPSTRRRTSARLAASQAGCMALHLCWISRRPHANSSRQRRSDQPSRMTQSRGSWSRAEERRDLYSMLTDARPRSNHLTKSSSAVAGSRGRGSSI